jgi:misacylated tRNA(Ala) deacylase
MARYLCQDYPDVLQLEAEVLDARPGAVLLARSPFYPGGGGQLPDRGTLTWSGGEAWVIGFEADERGLWHRLGVPAEVVGSVTLTVEPSFRALMCELHTLAHVVNSLVYTHFDGALLTGVRMSDDGTFSVDFDLPGVEADRLRALERPISDVIAQDLPVRADTMRFEAAQQIPGMFRAKSVAPPPQADGTVRIIEILGLDRQVCGGTHLSSTGRARKARVLKIDNKGRQNRRIRVGLEM